MTTIVTRAGKGSPLTNAEMDANLTNLNNDKVETSVFSAFGLTLVNDADAATARQTLGLPNTGPISGLRNLIINGNFAINQRGAVSGAAVGAANTYTLDRWRVVTSGQAMSWTVSGNGNLVTAPAGGIEQVIEGASIAGGTYALNWDGTASATVNGSAVSKGGTVTLTANTNATVRFSGGTVGEVQLEPGSVVTPFELRPAAVEMMLCQRYYLGKSEFRASVGAAGRPYYLGASWLLPVQMRATPTIVYSDLTGIASSVTINNGTVNTGQTFGAGGLSASPVALILDADWAYTSTPYGVWVGFQAELIAEL